MVTSVGATQDRGRCNRVMLIDARILPYGDYGIYFHEDDLDPDRCFKPDNIIPTLTFCPRAGDSEGVHIAGPEAGG